MKKPAKRSPLDQLIAACTFGGETDTIRALVACNEFSPDELRRAIDSLEKGATSSLEAQVARQNVDFLKRLLRR